MEYLQMYWIFFKVGLFTIGGGLAAIPLLQEEVVSRGWITATEFTDMIAVSESTPGPIGVNVATYIGFSQYGVLGSIIATIGLVTPSVIIIMIIAKFILHYREKPVVKHVFDVLRPIVTGIILVAAARIATITLIDIESFEISNDIIDLFNILPIIMFFAFLYATNKWKHHPIFYIAIAGIIGAFIF